MIDDVAQVTEAAVALVGGPDLETGQEMPEPLEPDLETFPWLADLDG